MPEAEPLLAVPTEGENLVADYASLGFTLGRHPLALLRRQLERRRVVPAEVLASLPNKAPVRIAGLVTHRQRPESANGVTFVTLEDETGHINTIVWPRLGEHQRKTLISARLLGIVGKLQRDGDVVQVIATELQDYSALLGSLHHESREFR